MLVRQLVLVFRWSALPLAALGACSATPLGATEAGVLAARQKAPGGAEIFERECASCHGKRGEGLSAAPNIMGLGALPVYARDPSTSNSLTVSQEAQQQDRPQSLGDERRQPFKTAQDLYNYVSRRMPLPNARIGSLTEEQYWAVVNFVLVAHGISVPEGGANPQNAATIQLGQQ